ncbi:MAG: hypothetical protein ACYCTB_01280 [bacterium]
MLKTFVKLIILKTRKISVNENGVALVMVLLITLILSLLAAIAIDTTGTDVINAGQNYKASYTLNTSNSMMNLVAMEIATNIGTNAGINIPISGNYYYTVANPPAGGPLIQECSSAQANCPSYPPQFSINTAISQNLGFQGNAGFEYTGQYGPVPGFSLNKYVFYKGIVYSIANKNINSAKTTTTGMNFNYGPMKIGY